MEKHEMFSSGPGALAGSCKEFHEIFGFHKKGEKL
jgi:hypothetical protein